MITIDTDQKNQGQLAYEAELPGVNPTVPEFDLCATIASPRLNGLFVSHTANHRRGAQDAEVYANITQSLQTSLGAFRRR